MTVLRSREIVPTVSSQSPSKTLKMEIIEPMTPAKTLEPSNLEPCCTPSSTASARTTSPLGLGSDSGTARRRSLRLASIRSVGETNPSVVTVSNRKRKNVVADNLLINIGGGGEGINEISPVKEIRVSNRVRTENSVPGRIEVVSAVDEVTVAGGVSEISSPSDLGTFRQVSEGVVSDKKGKLGNGVDFWDSDCSDKGFVNLRSGKKICKRGMEGSSGDGDKAFHGNGGGMLNGGIEDDDLMGKSETNPVGDGIGSLDVVEKVELDLGCKVDISASNVLDEDQIVGVNDSGIKAQRRFRREDKGKEKVVADDLVSNDNAVLDTVDLPENSSLKESEKDPTGGGNFTYKARRRLTREEKGKGKVVGDGLLSNGGVVVKSETKPEVLDSIKIAVSGILRLADDVPVNEARQVEETHKMYESRIIRETKKRFRDIARKNASRFAHFSSQEVEENHATDEAESEIPGSEVKSEVEDWPGPFSTAMKIIQDRAMNLNVLRQNFCFDKSKPASVIWVPKKDLHRDSPKLLIPTLQDLCLNILAKNADAITSLDCVPDALRHKLSQLLCDSRRMNTHFLDLLVQGSPTEIRIRDCSWLTEGEFTSIFEGCETNNLTVLQLDQCGCCIPDYVLVATLARSSNCLPALTTLSFKGNYRLSDCGLSSLAASSPGLRSINLSQCSLLTSEGISTLADSLGLVLKELYIDDCQNIDALLILPALSKLEHLEVLSLAGVETVCDDFLCKFIAVRGHHIRELVLTDCTKLTDSSLKVIAECCTGLCSLDLGNLLRLTDSTMGYLANGCQAIQTLKLCRNSFSDEVVAAYLEASGESLKELSLNNVIKVGHNTAVSIAKCSRKLVTLDLSWCRNLTDDALGLIVDSCLSLKVLKLLGCTQVTNVFLDGHSNPEVQIIGLKLTPILEHLKLPDPLAGPLHYSSVLSS